MGFLTDIWTRLVKGNERNVPELTPLFDAKPSVPPAPLPRASNDNEGDYRVYTREFDRIMTADELNALMEGFGPAGKSMAEEDWAKFNERFQVWRTRCHLRAVKAATILAAETSEQHRNGTVVSLLLDQSGSMRGERMAAAAAAIDVAQDFLHQLGCQVEILGFTTHSWHGGKAHRKWIQDGQPPHPGRVCDLLHVIYRAADDARVSGASWAPKLMLWRDLPKENVDGEALQWAVSRLRRRPETHKILMVLSDGAPYEKATLGLNGDDYLDRHLHQVASDIDRDPHVTLAAIGIGFDVSRYYSKATLVKTADDLGESLPRLLTAILTGLYAQRG